MWVWFLIGYAAFVAVLVAYAAHMALSARDKQHRADAYRVLRLIWGTGSGASGLVVLVVNFHCAGLL